MKILQMYRTALTATHTIDSASQVSKSALQYKTGISSNVRCS
jgi:hypothetical protein